MSSNQRADIPVVSGGSKVLLALMGLFVVAAVYRLFNGLGATTNLSDTVPWGLWIGIDVLVGVALAAGGFTITAIVYIFNMKKYKPITKPAVLTAYLGYLMVCVGIFFDIGKPHTLWHPLVMWQPQSIMFEVVWCVVIYTSVLTFEFAPSLLKGMGKDATAAKFESKGVLFPLVIAGITLSFLHQSSLGALYLLMPAKLNHLWWSTMLPYNFYISAIAAGMAMISFESVIAGRIFNHKIDLSILQGLAKGTAGMLLLYLVVRLGDLALKGNLQLMLDGSGASKLFLLEIIGCAFIPMIMLSTRSVRESVSGIFMAQTLVIVGVVLNRCNVNFLSQLNEGGSYFPSWVEISVTVGLIATLMFLYRVAVIKLPIFTHAEADQ